MLTLSGYEEAIRYAWRQKRSPRYRHLSWPNIARDALRKRGLHPTKSDLDRFLNDVLNYS